MYRGLALPLILLSPALAASTMEEVVITASPHGKSASEVAGSLNILSGEKLQREVASTLGETLKNQAGINASSFGPGVGLPVIRGLSGKRVKILQNSSPLEDASATSPDHAIALEPMLADRIEILRGPAGLRFGPGAIGGVVNIIDNRIHTEPFSGMEGALETRYDSNGDGKVTVGRLDGGTGTWNAHLSGVVRSNNDVEIPGLAALDVDDGGETSNGFVANTDGEADAWSLGLSRVTDRVVIGFGLSRVNNAYGIPPGGHSHHHEEHDEQEGGEHEDEEHVDEAHEDEEHEDGEDHLEEDIFTRIDMRQTEYSGKILFPDLAGVFNKLDIDLSHTEYQHQELEVASRISNPGTEYATNANNLRAELSHGSSDGWLGALGLQLGDTEFVAQGEEAFVPPNRVRTAGLFATEETGLGAGTLELGLRFDRQGADPDNGSGKTHNLINAGASYLYPLGEHQQFSVIFSHSQRAPTAEELFSLGEHAATRSYQVGDGSLDRESSNSLEFTWSYTGPVSLNASLYHREFSDFIFEAANGSRFSHDLEEGGFSGAAACSSDTGDFDNDEAEFGGAPPCYFYQQEDARFTGGEAEMVAQLGDISLRLWGDMVRARLDNSGDVPRMPPARVGTSLDFNRGMWTMGLGFSHGFEQDNPGALETGTGSYNRIDAHLSLGNEQWTLFLKGNNLSDEDIRNATSFLRDIAPEPGRSLVIGARLNF